LRMLARKALEFTARLPDEIFPDSQHPVSVYDG